MTREKNTPTPGPRLLPAPSSHPTPTGPEAGLLAAQGLGQKPDVKVRGDAPFDKRLDIAWTKWGSL